MILLHLIYVPLVLSSLDLGIEDTDLKIDTCTSKEEFSLILSEMPKKNLRHNGPATTLRDWRRQGKSLAETKEATRINNIKKKACDLMEQAMYATQELIWPVEPFFKYFETQPPYRMAYIFLQMEQAVADAKAIIKMIERRRTYPNQTALWTPSQRLQLFWQLLKRHMDLTYLLDYLRERIPLGTEGVDTAPPDMMGAESPTPAPDTQGRRNWWTRRPTGSSSNSKFSASSGRKYLRH